jgi:hypothetical protein
MEKLIKVTIKTVYGKETIYPKNEEAKTFCELIGQKSLTRDNIKLIKKLGYNVEVVADLPEAL